MVFGIYGLGLPNPEDQLACFRRHFGFSDMHTFLYREKERERERERERGFLKSSNQVYYFGRPYSKDSTDSIFGESTLGSPYI